MHFWESSTNTMQLKCGMLTPTLLDVAAITGLPPTGEAYDPDRECDAQFTPNPVTYGPFMNTYFDQDTTKVSDTKHIAFLAFWLSQYVFGARSLQIPRSSVIMAIQLHEVHSFCLSKLLLGNIYDSMRTRCQTMRTITDKKTLNLAGPWWLF